MMLYPCPTTGGEHEWKEGGARDWGRYHCARCQVCLQTGFAIASERDQRKRAEKAEAMIRSLEWSCKHDDGDVCPECRALERESHARECALGAFIRELGAPSASE